VTTVGLPDTSTYTTIELDHAWSRYPPVPTDQKVRGFGSLRARFEGVVICASWRLVGRNVLELTWERLTDQRRREDTIGT